MNQIEQLQEMINKSQRIVFFGGAGVSTDSGMKDFRGKNGLYQQKKEGESPEYLLSIECFKVEPLKFFNYYRKNMNCLSIQPNITHFYLSKLEKEGKLKAIITQNIDGLHQKAGSKCVYELHGTIHQNHCIQCGKFYNAEFVFQKTIPICECGGIVKPDVILYGEMLPDDFNKAQREIKQADMLIVAGTSLTVYPASGLIHLFQGKYFVILNDTKTPYDAIADLVIHDNLSKIFQQLQEKY